MKLLAGGRDHGGLVHCPKSEQWSVADRGPTSRWRKHALANTRADCARTSLWDVSRLLEAENVSVMDGGDASGGRLPVRKHSIVDERGDCLRGAQDAASWQAGYNAGMRAPLAGCR